MNSKQNGLPVIVFAGYSGSGKTQLISALIPLFRAAGLKSGVIKHAHHGLDLDTPGKDTYRFRDAGAQQVLVASNQRWALLTENSRPADPELEVLLQHLDHTALDLVLVEGFKHWRGPKYEVHRAGNAKPLLYPEDASIIAIITDQALIPPHPPRLDLNQADAVFQFMREHWNDF